MSTGAEKDDDDGFPPPEPATCATCEGYGYVNPGLHEKDCPDCTTQPASVADGVKETK